MNIADLTITEARIALKRSEFSAVELAEAYLKNIAQKNDELNAYLEVYDDVLDQAKAADKKLPNFQTSKLPNLTGVPIALKDNILVEGKRVTASSKILGNYRATYDAFVTRRLKEAGAVLLGRTNCDEFAMGSSTENSAFGVTRNPHDATRVPGGSSGGSAAAVAANMALAALGSDTGGSIRQPAGFCGIVGLKSTYGTVSRSGLIALGSSLDQIGPLAKTVTDAEILWNAIKGHDPMDSTSLCEEDTRYKKQDTKKIGVPRRLIEQEGIDERVLKNFNASIEKLKSLGYEIQDIELPNVEASLAVYYIIMPAEASTNLARYDGVKYGLHVGGKDLLDDYLKTRSKGFGAEVKRRILIGTYVLSSGYYDAYYNKAVAVRSVITDSFNTAFKHVDVIATPTSPTPPFKIGEKSKDPLAMYLSDIFTVPANITGFPSMSVPSGSIEEGRAKLPDGLLMTAPRLREHTLFAVGKDFLGES